MSIFSRSVSRFWAGANSVIFLVKQKAAFSRLKFFQEVVLFDYNIMVSFGFLEYFFHEIYQSGFRDLAFLFKSPFFCRAAHYADVFYRCYSDEKKEEPGAGNVQAYPAEQPKREPNN